MSDPDTYATTLDDDDDDGPAVRPYSDEPPSCWAPSADSTIRDPQLHPCISNSILTAQEANDEAFRVDDAFTQLTTTRGKVKSLMIALQSLKSKAIWSAADHDERVSSMLEEAMKWDRLIGEACGPAIRSFRLEWRFHWTDAELAYQMELEKGLAAVMTASKAYGQIYSWFLKEIPRLTPIQVWKLLEAGTKIMERREQARLDLQVLMNQARREEERKRQKELAKTSVQSSGVSTHTETTELSTSHSSSLTLGTEDSGLEKGNSEGSLSTMDGEKGKGKEGEVVGQRLSQDRSEVESMWGEG